MKFIIKNPSAWLPLLMSCAALALLLSYLSFYGIPDEAARHQDEGTAAHLFQLLMGGQLPIIAYFGLRWLPQAPRQAFIILAMQFLAGALAFAPIYIFQM